MKICVFLSSSRSNNSLHIRAIRKLGKAIALGKHELIYGGTKLGLMTILADEVLKWNGKVIGVISKEFNKEEYTHNGLTKLYIADNMNERIMKQEEISDIFIMLPGGIGTFNEFFKIWALNKVQKIKKPLIILNIAKLFDPFIKQIHTLNVEGFIKKSEIEMISIYNDMAILLENIFTVVPSHDQRT